MRKRIATLAVTFVLALGAGAVLAQSGHGAMQGMSASAMKGMGGHKMMAMNEDMAAMKKMDKAMMSAKGSTPDIMFARMMLAHHQGALDMAQIELKTGADAEAKRMAQQIIVDQTKNKGELEAWLKSHGG